MQNVVIAFAIVIAGLTGNLRCPIGVGHDEERGSGMTEEKEVHGTISSLPGAIVIAGLTGNLVG